MENLLEYFKRDNRGSVDKSILEYLNRKSQKTINYNRGVYIVQSTGNYAGVEVRSDEHYFIVSLTDEKEQEWTHLFKSVKNHDSEVRMPTEDEWMLIGANLDEINTLLKAMRGQEISTDEWYWTCDELVSSGHKYPLVYDTLEHETFTVEYSDKYPHRLIRVFY